MTRHTLGCLLLAAIFLSGCATYKDCRSENIPKGQCVFVTIFENIQP